MSSCFKSLLDPKKNRSATEHMNAISRRIRNYGFTCNEMDSKESLNRLPREVANVGSQFLRPAMDLSSKSGYLTENVKAMQFLRSSLAYAKEVRQIPVLNQARFLSSAASAQKQSTPTDTAKNILRPLSPHLAVYKPQRSSTLSITNRITGAFLTVILLSFHFIYLKMGPICASFSSFYQLLFYSSKLTMVSLELSALALGYHALYGLHHLWSHYGKIIAKRVK